MKRPKDYAGGDQDSNLAALPTVNEETTENPKALSNAPVTEG
jgi:hypothetical protein